MSTSVPTKPKHGDGPSSHISSAVEDDDEEDDTPTINDVISLKQGIIKTTNNKAKTPYTVLLLGETGVGKSSVLEFIANVLIGNGVDHYNFNILDSTNEQGGSSSQSQTNLTRTYELTSSNGIVVRILDTPGLADTRRLQQDELHRRSITSQIKEHIDSVTAVLVLVNGTVPRITIGSNYALSILSAIFTKSLASNIAFLFTNVLSPLHWNFSEDTIPDVLRGAPHFLVNNPVALQKKYLKLKDDPCMKIGSADFRKAVTASEEDALEMLVDFFDWLDSLEPQSITKNVPPYQEAQKIMSMIPDVHAPMDQVAVRKEENSVSHKSAEEKEVGRQQLGTMRGGREQKKGFRRKAEEKMQERVQRFRRALSVSRGK